MSRLFALSLTRFPLALALWFPLLADAQSQADLQQQLQARAGQFFEGQQPGGVVLVRKGDAVLLRQGYGLADVENQVAMTPDKVLRLASVSKQFTAFAILQMVQAGKLQLDQPVGAVLPDLPPALAKVSLYRLLTHTSGVKNISQIAESRAARRNDADIDSLIAFFKDLPLEFEPGSRFEYSNSNYILLTKVIETVSGKRYAEHMQQAVFGPLGMRHTRVGSHTDLIPGRAQGYRLVEGRLQNADFISMTQPQGAGALISTVDDLNRWDLALHAGKLVDKALLDKTLVRASLNDGSSFPYAFGWMFSEVQGEASQEHSGFINGFSSYTLRLPGPQIYVTVLANSEQFWPDDFAVELAAIALGRAYDKTPAAPSVANAWIGRYDFGQGDVRELKRDGDQLFLVQQGADPTPLMATVDGRFYLGAGLDYLRFETRADGKRAMIAHSRLLGEQTGLRGSPFTDSTVP